MVQAQLWVLSNQKLGDVPPPRPTLEVVIAGARASKTWDWDINSRDGRGSREKGRKSHMRVQENNNDDFHFNNIEEK